MNVCKPKTILEDGKLVGDVTCAVTATPCIAFGAPELTLRLHGFNITGPGEPDDPASPNSDCAARERGQHSNPETPAHRRS